MPQKTTKRKTDARGSRALRVPWVALVLMVLMGLWAAGCKPHWLRSRPDPNRLASRIDQYYNALQAQAFTKMHLFYAARQSPMPSQQSSLASKLPLKLASYEIQSMAIDKTDARVVMHVTIAGLENNYDIMMVDHWQFIDGTWYVVPGDQPNAEEDIEPFDAKILQKGIQW